MGCARRRRIGFDTPNRLHYLATRDQGIYLVQEQRKADQAGRATLALIAARATDYDAAGVRITSLPITAAKVRQALREKQAMGAKEGSHA